MIATLTGIGILNIRDDEAEALEGALKEVAKHYQLEISGPRAAMIQLVGVASMIYVPRAVMVANVVRQHKRNQRMMNGQDQEEPTEFEIHTPGETAPPPNPGTMDFSGEALSRAVNRQRRRGH